METERHNDSFRSGGVSIVIPCRNEVLHIKKCIESLISNGYPVDLLEVLVIDGNSTDGTQETIHALKKEYPQIILINNPHQKTPFALNLGIEHAKGEYILIASAHSSFEKHYITTLVEAIKNLNAEVVGGVMETQIKNQTPTSIAIKEVLSHPLGVGNSLFRVGVKDITQVDTVPFGLYKTSLLRTIGGYDTRLIRNHDIELSKRLLAHKASIYLIPEARCTYYARETWGKLGKNNFDNGLWNLRTVFITKDFSSLSVRHFIPLVFILSIITPCFLALFHPYFLFLSALSLLTYLMAVVFISFKISNRATTRYHLLITFIVLHFSYGFGSFLGIFNFYKLFNK
jgi:glycosyltransferase involved in cell wall biosynthesis